MKKFFKKPLNIVSLVLAVLGLVGMIVILCVPHGGKYSYKGEIGGVEYKQTVTFKGDKLYFSDDDEGLGTSYEIKDGKLVVGGIEYSKINAFKFDIKIGTQTATYKCTMSYVFFIVACVMLAVGASGMIYGAVAKPKKKKK